MKKTANREPFAPPQQQILKPLAKLHHENLPMRRKLDELVDDYKVIYQSVYGEKRRDDRV